MVGNLNLSGISRLQCLLYTNFRIKKKYHTTAVASKMGVHSDTLHKWINGTKLFPADRLASLVIATDDVEYLECILDECDMTPIPKIKDKHTAKMFAQMVKLMQSAIESSGKDE